MNSQNTKISESIVTDSIKSDKLAYIYNTPIFNKKGVDFDSFEKHLLYILMFARQYPDSGAVKIMLSDINKRIKEWHHPQEEKKKTESIVWGDVDVGEDGRHLVKVNNKNSKAVYYILGGGVRAMSAICIQIALENVGCVHYALRIISCMIDSFKDMKEKQSIIDLVYNKLCNQPNFDYNQLWLQNITYTHNKKIGTSPYSIRLCKLVMGNIDEPIWNNEWIRCRMCLKYANCIHCGQRNLKKVTSPYP